MNLRAVRCFRSFAVGLILAATAALATGCVTSVKSSVVKPGTCQMPAGVRPLVFVNLRVVSGLNYLLFGNAPLRMDGFAVENVATHERTTFFFNQNPFIKDSVTLPFEVNRARNSVYTPALITVPPGEYYFDAANITRVYENQATDTYVLFKDHTLKLIVPDQEFVSWGTVEVALKEKPGVHVGDVMQGFKVESNDKFASQCDLAPEESAFAFWTFPLLRNRVLAPGASAAP